jgi:hypothetical protein
VVFVPVSDDVAWTEFVEMMPGPADDVLWPMGPQMEVSVA